MKNLLIDPSPTLRMTYDFCLFSPRGYKQKRRLITKSIRLSNEPPFAVGSASWRIIYLLFELIENFPFCHSHPSCHSRESGNLVPGSRIKPCLPAGRCGMTALNLLDKLEE